MLIFKKLFTFLVEGEFRLLNLEYVYQYVEFRVQVRRNNSWTEICPIGLSNIVANQLCLQFGYESSGLNSIKTYAASSGPNFNFVSIDTCLSFKNITSDCSLLNELQCVDGLVLGLHCVTLGKL